jgi:hypothetical protein
MKWDIYYATGVSSPGAFANIVTGISNGRNSFATSNNTVSLSLASGSTIYFRVYGYNTKNTTFSYLCYNSSFSISVSSPSVPAAFSAIAGNTKMYFHQRRMHREIM